MRSRTRWGFRETKDKASGTQVIQELIAAGCSRATCFSPGGRQDHAPARPYGDDRERFRLAGDLHAVRANAEILASDGALPQCIIGTQISDILDVTRTCYVVAYRQFVKAHSGQFRRAAGDTAVGNGSIS